MAIIYLSMKYISALNLKFYFLLKLPYGNKIQNLRIKLMNWWGMISSIWVYVILILVIIHLAISARAIYVVLSHIQYIFPKKSALIKLNKLLKVPKRYRIISRKAKKIFFLNLQRLSVKN